MSERNTVVLSGAERGLRAAAGLLRAGELVAFPTETVYGLGADALSDRAVAGIFAAKGRPAFNPLIVHVADLAAAEGLAVFPAEARALAARFWPGPLTLVLPRRAEAPVSPSAPPPASPAWRCGCRGTRWRSASSPASAARSPRPRPTSPAGSAPPRPPTSSRASAAASPPCSTAAPARSASN